MYTTTLNDTSFIDVKSRKHSFHYATDHSLANPLEAAYASLVGCAGVYTLKAAKKLAKSVEGIKIEGKLILKPENPSVPQKWITTVQFPEDWTVEEKIMILNEIKKCAVKELIQKGSQIEFLEEIL